METCKIVFANTGPDDWRCSTHEQDFTARPGWAPDGTTSCADVLRVLRAAHYNMGQFEVIDVLEDWGMGFHLGNTIKYIARSTHKGAPREDLKKALWYLNRYRDKYGNEAPIPTSPHTISVYEVRRDWRLSDRLAFVVSCCAYHRWLDKAAVSLQRAIDAITQLPAKAAR